MNTKILQPSTITTHSVQPTGLAGPATKKSKIEPLGADLVPAGLVPSPELETLFVNSDAEAEILLDHLQQSPNNHVALIRTPEDLDQDDLRRRFQIYDDGRSEELPGQLLESQDDRTVTLVMDFRQFEPSQYGALNSLLDSPPTLDGRELGGHVRIISLVSQDLFPGHDSETGKAGQDFSRRMARGFSRGLALAQQLREGAAKNIPHCSLESSDYESSFKDSGKFYTAAALSSQPGARPVQTLLKESVPEYSLPAEHSVYTIDLSWGDWREVLFGCADIDEQGRRYYRRGQLAYADAGEALVLKGAPWQDEGFRHTLYTVIRTGQYYANGEYHTLPENIIWQRQPVTAEDIEQRKDCIQWTCEPTPNPAIINGDNLDLLLCKNKFSEHGTLLRHNSFPEYLSGCSGIRITSPLTTRQWTRLLGAVRAAGLTSVPVYLDTPELQPSPFQGPEPEMGDDHCFFQPAPPMHSEQVTLIKGDDSALRYGSAQAAESMDTGTPCDSDQVLNIVVTPDLSLTRLLAHLRLVSLTQARFERQEQSIVSALKTGKIVRIRGLESNPTLARQLESLLASPPMLMINGQPETFENCHIEVYWPGNATPESAIWQAALEATAQQPEMSTQALKTWLQNRYGLNDTGIVDCIDQLSQLINPHVPANQKLSLNCDLLSKLVIQAQSERQQTGEQQLSIAHWRKAINSVLLKSYRNNRELYSFCKLAVRGTLLPDEDDNWVDPVALVQWLKQHPNPDIATVQQHFWQLTRCLGCSAINRLPGKMGPGQSLVIPADCEPFQLLARQLVKAAGQPLPQPLLTEVECQALQVRLGVQSQDSDSTLFFPRNLGTEKKMQDLCYELGLRCSQKQLRTIGLFVQLVRGSQHSDREKQRQFTGHLLSYFPQEFAESTAKLLLDPDNPKHWQHWYTRRKARLKAKVEQHPVTLVTGEPGAGKSFMAVEVAKSLQGGGPVQVISCGPQTRLCDLMVKETLVRSPETGEAEVIQAAGPLRQWADKRASQEQPAVIVIDEANLCDPAVWNGLKGLYEPEPYITDQHGHSIPITEHHHIIMTGNPVSMTGRRLNPLLKDRAPELFFRPLNDPFMASQIVRPALETVLARLQQHGVSVDIAATQTKLNNTVMALFNQYKRLIPDHEFSPRDLTDFNSRLLSYVNSACAEGLDKQTWQQLDHALAGLVWQSMADSLGGLVHTGIRWQLQALEAWYRVTFGLESGLTQPHQNKFETFFDRWLVEHRKEGSDFNLDNQSVRELARVVWLELDRLESCAADIPGHFKGRCATVIEGPAGRGKDDLVQRLIHEWNRQQQDAGKAPIPMQAIALDPNHPDPFYKTLAQTSRRGEIMVGSEMNLVQSQYHEGQMNDLLTGSSAPGFHLFATINPATFVGRHRFSSALKSRCNQILIGDYSLEDLTQVACTLFPNHPQLAKEVSKWHWQLKSALRAKAIPQCPTVGDMKTLAGSWLASLSKSAGQPPVAMEVPPGAMEVSTQAIEQTDKQRLKQQFETTYGFYFQFLASEANPDPSLDDIQTSDIEELLDSYDTPANLNSWTEWLHQQIPSLLTQPVSVIGGSESTYDSVRGILTLRQTLLDSNSATRDQQIQREIIRLFIQERWQRQLPLKSPHDNDILFSAAYHSWQQVTAKAWFADQPHWAVQAEQIFPLSQEERETLALSNNCAYLTALEQLARLEPSTDSLAMFEKTFFPAPPLFNGKKINTNQAKTAKELAIAKQIETITQNVLLIELSELPSVQLDKVRPYQRPISGTLKRNRYFEKNDPNHIRDRIYNATLKDGCICLEDAPMGTRGYEVIIPTWGVPKGMAKEEDSGAFHLTIRAGEERQWHSIPGIGPHQKLFALEVKPVIELEVIRDRATHMHYVRSKTQQAFESGTAKIYLVKVGICHQLLTVPENLDDRVDTVFRSESLAEALGPVYEHDAAFQWLRDLRGKSMVERCDGLRAWFANFPRNPKQVPSSPQSFDVESLRQHLVLQYGSSRHRAVGFQAMATWLGIPSRIVTSEHYTYVEVSTTTKGYRWHMCDLGTESHPDLKVEERPALFTKTTPGLTVSKRVQSAIGALGQESRRRLVAILDTSDQALESWLHAEDGTPIPLGQGFWGFGGQLLAQEHAVKLVEKILDDIGSDDQESSRELLKLAILLLPSIRHDHLFTFCYHTLIPDVTKAVIRVFSADSHCMTLFCQVLTELADTVNDPDIKQIFGYVLDRILQDIPCDKKIKGKPILTRAGAQLAAFILLDNNWLPVPIQLTLLHALARLETYGEQARLKLDIWYDSLYKKLDCAQAASLKREYPATGLALADNPVITALTQQGHSRSLESRLMARGSIEYVYGWDPSDRLDNDRMLRRRPFFQKSAKSVTLPSVVLVIPFNKNALGLKDHNLKHFYLPLAQGRGQLDRNRAGQRYDLPGKKRLSDDLVETLGKQWFGMCHYSLLIDINKRELPVETSASRWTYRCRDIATRKQIVAAVKKFHQQHVVPVFQFDDEHIPLVDILHISFYQYLYKTIGVDQGNVKVLYSGHDGNGHGLTNHGFFQPVSQDQWRNVFSISSRELVSSGRLGKDIDAGLLQRNGRFEQETVITWQQLLVFWREFIDSLGDLDSVKKFCVTKYVITGKPDSESESESDFD